MEIVIDTSAIMAVITDEPDRPAIINVTRGVTLRAPNSVHWEIGNAFSAMFKRGRITKAKALKAIALYQRIPIAFADVKLEEAIEIAAHHNVYAYDAYLLVCAQRFGSPLLSLDVPLTGIAKTMGLNIINL